MDKGPPFENIKLAPQITNARTRFNDRVRVLATPATQSAGIAGLLGTVYGHTVPSSSGRRFIGTSPDDVAVGVEVDGRGVFFIAEDFLEILETRPVIQIGGKRFVYDGAGWTELPPT